MKEWPDIIKKPEYLDLWDNGAFLSTGAGERRQGGWRHHGVGAGEVAQVAAGNLILLVSHDDGFHDKEAVPGQPEGMLLRDEGCPFESQDDGDAAVRDQVKAAGRRTAATGRRRGRRER